MTTTDQFLAQLQPLYTTTLIDPLYYVDDVTKLFRPSWRIHFNKWLRGKTLFLLNDREAIYKHDVEQFLDGFLKVYRY